MHARKLDPIALTTLAMSGLSLSASAGDAWKPAAGPLMTKWARDVSVAKALPEYPRPQMVRKDWQNLNGLWDYALGDTSAAAPPANFDGRILVPFPWESALSGIGRPSAPDKRLWYRRSFDVPAAWAKERVLLHFGALNWEGAVWLNGRKIGDHKGGYDPFSFDITDALKSGGNEIVVAAWNPVKAEVPDAQVLGKQRLKPGGIFYTPATGIWQTVWIEPVPAAHIVDLKITPDVDDGSLKLTVRSEGAGNIKVTAFDGPKSVAEIFGGANAELRLPISNPHLWSPDDPHLYDLKVSLLSGDKEVDTVASYFAMRKVALGKDDKGRTRIFLNGKPAFEMGVLDQGYWPDGIYTAPTDEALRYDVEMTKKLGFTLSRKHAKVEPDRWYYWTDKLGVLVWQDMPQMFGRKEELSDEAKEQFEIEWRREIAALYNHPSIIVWTTFNEGWGQHDTERIVALTKDLDPTRLVNNASGWTDRNVGDLHDTHAYPGPGCEPPSPTRASVNGEFGGLGMRVDGHMWSQDPWGYQGVYSRAYSLTRKYQQLLERVHQLSEERGMSAAVYTQLTDVENEGNGLLTYDRAIIKPDLAIVAAANQGRFPPLPPDPHPPLVPTGIDEPQPWRFTTANPGDNWMRADFDASGWKEGNAPFGHGIPNARSSWTTADIWLRRDVTLPENLPAKLVFDVFHDEDVEIYLNGVLAGSAAKYTTDYVQIPMNEEGRAALKPGRNTIAVHCHQTVGGQFIDAGIAEPN